MSVVLYLLVNTIEKTTYYGLFGYTYESDSVSGASGYKSYKATDKGLIKINKNSDEEIVFKEIQSYIDGYGGVTTSNKREDEVLIAIIKEVLSKIEEIGDLTTLIVNNPRMAKLLRNSKHSKSINLVYDRNNINDSPMEIAEINSAIGQQLSSKGIEIFEVPKKKRWKSAITKPHMLPQSHILFDNRGVDDSGRYHYFGFKTKKDIGVGRSHSNTIYSLTRLKKEIPELEELKKKRLTISTYNTLSVISLVDFYTIPVLRTYEKYGLSIFKTVADRLPFFIEWLNKKIIISDLYPPGLGMRILKIISSFHIYLDEFEDFLHTGNQPATTIFIDITKDIAEHITPNDKDVIISINKRKLKLVYGVDLPARNNMKKLLDIGSTIWISISLKGNVRDRYYIFVNNNEGSLIWTNHYSNLVPNNGHH